MSFNEVTYEKNSSDVEASDGSRKIITCLFRKKMKAFCLRQNRQKKTGTSNQTSHIGLSVFDLLASACVGSLVSKNQTKRKGS